MASAAISRSLSSRPNPKPPSENPKTAKSPLKISVHWHNRPSVIRASLKEHGGGSRALELNRIFNGSPPDKVFQTLPRPLTTSDLSNLGSGSRLKVAYQAFEF